MTETATFVCETSKETKVTWLKDGKVLTPNKRIEAVSEKKLHKLIIHDATADDKAEYKCTVGDIFTAAILTVEAAEQKKKDELAESKDAVYSLISDYTEVETSTTFKKGERFMVLDSSSIETWVVCKLEEREKTYHIPPKMLKEASLEELAVQKREMKSASRSPSRRLSPEKEPGSSEEEDDSHMLEGFPIYVVLADYKPDESNKEGIRLSEGQFVEVLDMENSEYWLVRTKPTKTNPSKQGWVPSAYLEQKQALGTVKKTTREVFREEIIQITNKQQEATVKRSPLAESDMTQTLTVGPQLKAYALTDLLETEREYIKELKQLLDQFYDQMKRPDVPACLKDKKDVIFGNIKQIYDFHNDIFLAELTECANLPSTTGKIFTKMSDKFDMYIPYLYGRPEAEVLISTEEAKRYLAEKAAKHGATEKTLLEYLTLPYDRLHAYDQILKDFLRYTVSAGENAKELEKAIEMIMNILKRVDHMGLLANIEGYPGLIDSLGPIIRHDDMQIWDKDVTKMKSKDRHIFLFPEKLLITKKKKTEAITDAPTFAFKSLVDLQNIQINENLEDDRRFELWFAEATSEKLTLQAKNIYAKQAWVKDIRAALKNIGIEDTDITPEQQEEILKHKKASKMPTAVPKKGSPSPAAPKSPDDLSASDSDRKTDGTDYFSLDSYESDNTISSYHTAPEFEDGTSKPSFKKKLCKTVVNEGSPINLECVVAGIPLPKVMWLKESNDIKESDNVKIIENGDTHILSIKEATKKDDGMYTARATNVNGSLLCTAEVTVLEKIPEEKPSPKTKDAPKVPEISVTEESKAAGKPKEVEKPKETPVTEDVASVSAPTEEAPVRKGERPQYIMKMDDCLVEEGQMAKFECRIVAYPPPEITWMRDGQAITGEGRLQLTNINDDIYSLMIQATKLSDIGRYICWAKNEHGEAYTEAYLNVIPLDSVDLGKEQKPPQFIKPFDDIVSSEGKSAELSCKISGYPEPYVLWMANDYEVGPTEDFIIKKDGDKCSLKISKLSLADGGIYTCRISNPLGEASCTAKITVKPERPKEGPVLTAPKFIRKLDDITIRKGRNVCFECTTVGEPKPNIEWFYNGKPIKATDHYSIETDGRKHSLFIHDSHPDDDGEYMCKASNSEGEASTSGKLEIKEEIVIPKKTDEYDLPPAFTKRILNQEVKEGNSAKFECRAIGIPEVEVFWTKDGYPIHDSPRFLTTEHKGNCYLRIDNVRPEDAGMYACVITNRAGRAITSGSLKLELPHIIEPSSRKFDGKAVFIPDIPPERKAYDIPYHSEPLYGSYSARPVLLDIKPSSAKINWVPASSADLPAHAGPFTYSLECRELPQRTWKRLTTGIKGTSYNISDLNPDIEYMFRIKPEHKSIATEPTAPVTLPKRTAIPTFPSSKPAITDLGDESMRLAWRPMQYTSPHLKSYRRTPYTYRLEMRELPKEDWVPLASRIPDTSHYIHGLRPDRDYMIRVRAEIDHGVLSEPTYPITLQRAKGVSIDWEKYPVYPGIPIERPEIYDVEPTSVNVRWNRIDIPTFRHGDEPLLYMLEMQKPPEMKWYEIASSIPSTTYTIKDLEPSKDYRFRVRAHTSLGVTEPSPATSLYRTLAKTRQPIEFLDVEQYEPTSIHLRWKKADIPPFDSKDEPLLYMIESQHSPYADWHPMVSGVPTTSYYVSDLSPQRDYNFRVRALSEYGLSEPTPPVTVSKQRFHIKPPVSNLEITEPSSDSVTLRWKRIPLPSFDRDYDILDYVIEIQQVPGYTWKEVGRGIKGNFFRVTNLLPTFDYFFRLRANTKVGLTDPTLPVGLYRKPVPPRLSRSDVILTPIGTDSVNLSWKPAEIPSYQGYPVTYSVFMQEYPNTDWIPVARRITHPEYRVMRLKPDHDYRFRIQAQTESGVSEPTFPVSLQRRPAPQMPLYEPLLSDIGATTVTLAWKPGILPSGYSKDLIRLLYIIEFQEPPSESWYTVARDINDLRYQISGLKPDKDYLFRVRAMIGKDMSEATLPVYLARRAGPPRMLKDLPYIVDISSDTVSVAWRSAEIPSRIIDYAPVTYRIELQEMPYGEWITVAKGISATSFKLQNLHPNKDYAIRVRAENEFGLSEPTGALILKKRAVPPAMHREEPIVSDITAGSLRLSWRSAILPSYLRDTLPITYTIYFQEPPSSQWRPFVSRIPHTSYHLSGLNPEKDYIFRVHAETAFAFSEPSLSVWVPRYSSLKRPIETPQIVDVESKGLKLAWRPTRSPSIGKEYTYVIESQELPSREWKRVVGGVRSTSYKLTGLKPRHDYLFRIRAETSSESVSEPSVPVSYNRSRVVPQVPIEKPELFGVESESCWLSWRRLYIYPYNTDVNLKYTVEVREPPSYHWRAIATKLSEPVYKVTGLRPKSDYHFRIKPETMSGESLQPSLSVALHRTAAIPHVPVELPEITEVDLESIALKWRRVDIPPFDKGDSPLTFMIETQEAPHYEWKTVATGISDTSYRVTGLKSSQDYLFRIRGEYPLGRTAPSVTVPFYRRKGERYKSKYSKHSSSKH